MSSRAGADEAGEDARPVLPLPRVRAVLDVHQQLHQVPAQAGRRTGVARRQTPHEDHRVLPHLEVLHRPNPNIISQRIYNSTSQPLDKLRRAGVGPLKQASGSGSRIKTLRNTALW